jgi:hypothetical protein
MSTKKRKKNPAGLPFNKFFGEWADLLKESRAAESAVRESRALESRSRTAADFVPNLLREPRQTSLKPVGNAASHSFSPELWETVENWWPFRILRIASDTGDAEGYKRLLSYFLLELGVKPPKGVFTPFRWPHGRPRETTTELICAAWEAEGRPTPDARVLNRLVRTFYVTEFDDAGRDLKLKKNLRDRVLATLLRHQARATAKSQSIP